MNFNVWLVAAEDWADDDFAGTRMHQRENGRLHARKFQNEITRHQLRQELLVWPLRCLFAYRLTLSISLKLVSPDVAASLGINYGWCLQSHCIICMLIIWMLVLISLNSLSHVLKLWNFLSIIAEVCRCLNTV